MGEGGGSSFIGFLLKRPMARKSGARAFFHVSEWIRSEAALTQTAAQIGCQHCRRQLNLLQPSIGLSSNFLKSAWTRCNYASENVILLLFTHSSPLLAFLYHPCSLFLLFVFVWFGLEYYQCACSLFLIILHFHPFK